MVEELKIDEAVSYVLRLRDEEGIPIGPKSIGRAARRLRLRSQEDFGEACRRIGERLSERAALVGSIPEYQRERGPHDD